MGKHKLAAEWDGNDFQIRGIFNQPPESYGAPEWVFINCYCAADVNDRVKKKRSVGAGLSCLCVSGSARR